MKRLLTFLFVLGGMTLTHSAFAQAKDKKADSTKSTQKSTEAPSTKGGGTITIDESGAPKVKSKTQTTTAPAPTTSDPKPKSEQDAKSSQKSSTGSGTKDDAPIAIDESGSGKKHKGKNQSSHKEPNADNAPSTPDSLAIKPQ